MKRKLCSVLLALCMVLTLLPVSAMAEGGPDTQTDSSVASAETAGGTKYYDTLHDAVLNVKEGGTVTLLKSTEGSGIGTYKTATGADTDKDVNGQVRIPSKSFTIDFGGNTYSLNTPAVGSANYETQGFHFEWAGADKAIPNITLKNGTVNVAATHSINMKLLIQNYCNLTLDAITVDGTNLEKGWSSNGTPYTYVSSNCNGTVTIRNSKIISKDPLTDVAFDVDGCKFAYNNKPVNLTVEGDSQISGRIEVTKGNSLTIKSGAFTDLATAVAYAADGATIKLAADVALQARLEITDGKALTLDLNGHNISRTNSVIGVKHGNLTVTGKGKIYETAPNLGAITLWGSNNENDANYSVVTVGKDVTLEAWAPIFVTPYQSSGAPYAYGVIVNVNGATLNSLRDTSGDGGSAIYMNGQMTHAKNATQFNLNNATLTAAGGEGMYLAGYAETTITGGSIVGDQTGIEIRAGVLNINGATVTGNGTPTSITPNGNGSTADGAGVAVMQHTTKLPITVTISDGIISGYTGLLESNPQKNSAEDIAKVSVNVTGGKFTAINDGVNAVSSDDERIFLTGGTYSVDPTAYVASGAIARKDGDAQYTVVAKANLTSGVYMSNPADFLAPGYVSYKNSDDTYTVYYPVPVTSNNNNNSSSTTTKNPDGSTTTTTTDKATGAVTETTKNTDGSTTTVETRKDGSVTETNKTANGSVGTVKTDANGNSEISASISAADVNAAAKKNEPVAAPVSVAPAASSAAAPVIKLSVPANAGEVSVAIPVVNAKQGTVAIKVNPDGTEEIIKTAVITENGLVLGVKGSMQIKVINNSKNFADTVGHWAESDVDFVSARELFTGTAPQTFSPESATTRGMVVTVLARLAGESTDGGANWYDKGCAWAVTNGVSDGTDPNGTVTREQLAAMLYRYFGSPAVSGSLSFADASSVSEYAHDAMQWCVNNGIINGMDGLLNPQGQATRAQVSAMFARYIRLMSTK